MEEWFIVERLETIDSPALLVYPDRVAENIRLAIALSGGAEALRPHVKTHKMPDIVRQLLAAGVDKFKCATIAEAEMLAMAGAPDVLVAYQPTEPKIVRLAELSKAFPGTDFSCLIDNLGTADLLSRIFADDPFSVFIDLNVGMNRTGILPEDAPGFYRQCLGLKGISVTGLHAYDGHVRETNILSREKHAREVFLRCHTALQASEKIAPADTKLTLIMGGTPTFALHAATARQEGVPVQVSPGTFVFWDDGYTNILQEQPFSFAAVLLTRIISKIDEEHFCLDLGHKSVGAENPLDRRIRFLNQPLAVVISQNEEHLVVRVPAGSDQAIGDAWYGIPYHVCPTVALYEEAQTIVGHRRTGSWPVTARNRRIRF